MTFDAALTDLISPQFKTQMKKMAAQVDFCLFCSVFCVACNTVPENWHTCVNKGLTYLLNREYNVTDELKVDLA